MKRRRASSAASSAAASETTVETPETELPEIEVEAEETFEASASEPTPPEPPALPVIPEPPVLAEAPAPRLSWFQRLKAGLSRSSSAISDGIASVFTKRKLDAATLEEFEDLLIQADLGVATASAITEALAKGRFDKEIEGDEVKAILAEEVSQASSPRSPGRW